MNDNNIEDATVFLLEDAPAVETVEETVQEIIQEDALQVPFSDYSVTDALLLIIILLLFGWFLAKIIRSVI